MRDEPARLTPNQRARLEVIAGGGNPGAGLVQITPASEIEPAETRWLWDGRIPLGAVSLLVGRQGLGKSTFAVTLAAHTSRGTLAGHVLGEHAHTLFVTGEDTPRTTLVPRLHASRGELEKVAFVRVERDGIVSDLILPEQTEQLGEHARAVGARLIVLDPLTAFVGELNPNRNEDMRRILHPLNRLADRLDLAIVAILHFNKGEAEAVLDRVGGAGALTQAARSVLFFGLDPDDPWRETGSRRVLAHAKCNLGRLAPSKVVMLETVELPVGTASRAVMGEAIDVAARDVIETDSQRQDKREASHFLEVELAGGSMPASILIKKARGIGIDQRSLYRAKADLRIKSMPSPQSPGGWEWELRR
jgi:hypothetical protein